MAEFTIRAQKPGLKDRNIEADDRRQAEIIAETLRRLLWQQITINGEPWERPA